MDFGIEWEELSCRHYEVVVLLKHAAHSLIPFRSDHRCRGDVIGRLFKPELDFVDSFWLKQSPLCRVIVEPENCAALLPAANAEHCLANSVEWVIRLRFIDRAANILEHLKGAFADVEHARLIRRIALEVSYPSDPLPLEGRF